jgi:isochorismate synthase
MANQQLTASFADRIADRVDEAFARSIRTEQPVLISISEEIEPVDPLRLFANSAAYTNERWYWEHPEQGTAIAGAGVAANNTFPPHARFSAADRVQRALGSNIITDSPADDDAGGPIFFSAFGFDPERERDRDVWKGFPPVYLCVPRVLLVRRGDRHTLTFNMKVSAQRDVRLIRKSLTELQERTMHALASEIELTQPRVDCRPAQDDEKIAADYRRAVAHASQAVREGQFEKVVLARYRDVYASNHFDIPAALQRLRTDYPSCYTFAVARKETTFLGASPEQLIKQENKSVSAASLAGSIRRGATPDEDQALAQQLIDSQKDQQEHEICARAIRNALEPHCAELDAPESPQLLSFSNVHHLYTPITGTLSNGSTLIQLVERLHPTPAVGGYPRDESQVFIREHEGFDRGWYASPLGWMDANGNGEFIVTLRSAVVSGQRARLFAGCGIVGQSDPDQELAESEVKLRPMLAALGSDPS